MENIQEISNRLRQLRLASGMEQMEVANKLGYKSDSTISKWENGKNLPVGSKLVKLAELFNTTTDYILHGKESINIDTNLETLTSNYTNLSKGGKKELVEHSTKLLKAERKTEPATEVSEPTITYTTVVITGLVSAGHGVQQDDYISIDASVPQEDIPDSYDSVAKVIGDSMAPKIQDGDLLFIKETPQVDTNTLGIFQVNGENYVKKLRDTYLESLNKDYPNVPLSENDNIRTVGEIVKVYRERR